MHFPAKTIGPPTILLVDDELDILESLSDVVHEFVPAAIVRTAAGGALALDILKAAHVDLIITDYRMPQMDGLQFLEHVRKLNPSLPAIMISAFVDPRWEARAVNELGVKYLLRKPLDLHLFDAVLKSIFAVTPVLPNK